MDVVERAAEWAGIDLDRRSRRLLDRYRSWLREEAIPAGGLGPGEAERLDSRHLADSLCFAAAWRGRTIDRLADVGSGVGLPGIPLAITHPATTVSLIERSGRRQRLLRRAIRVLQLENTATVGRDVAEVGETWPVVVTRASLPVEQVARLIGLVEPAGLLVVGGSHRAAPDAPGFETIEVPVEILASPAWLLTMAPP
jgi:16S rRNA (guanine527-N7)-methyltransferase